MKGKQNGTKLAALVFMNDKFKPLGPHLTAFVVAFVMTLPAVGMIVAGFTGSRVIVGIFGIGLYVIMISFYVVTAYLMFGHYD